MKRIKTTNFRKVQPVKVTGLNKKFIETHVRVGSSSSPIRSEQRSDTPRMARTEAIRCEQAEPSRVAAQKVVIRNRETPRTSPHKATIRSEQLEASRIRTLHVRKSHLEALRANKKEPSQHNAAIRSEQRETPRTARTEGLQSEQLQASRIRTLHVRKSRMEALRAKEPARSIPPRRYSIGEKQVTVRKIKLHHLKKLKANSGKLKSNTTRFIRGKYKTSFASRGASTGFQATLKTAAAASMKRNMRQLRETSLRQSYYALDSHADEEHNIAIQSLLDSKAGISKTKRSYRKISTAVDRLKGVDRFKGRSIKSMARPKNFMRVRNIKSASSAAAAGNKFLTKKALATAARNNAFKSGLKKVLASPAAALKRGAMLVAKQLAAKAAAAVAANPYTWAAAAVVAILLVLMMTITNGGGMNTAAAGTAFMADESTIVKYKDFIKDMDTQFKNQIESYRNADYDDVRIEYMNEEGTLQTNWVEILAIVAVKYEQELEFAPEQQTYMQSIFDLMNRIETREETYTETECSGSGEERTCETVTKTRLIVEIYSYSMEDIFGEIGFNEEQQEWARRLVTSDVIREQFPDLVDSIDYGSNPLTPEELQAIRDRIGENIDGARRDVIEAGLTLEGRVKYFWGGKSPAGWNDDWGTPKLVTAPGSKTTGTYQPFGLDCSGFIDWAFKTAGLGNTFSAGGTSYQWTRTRSITWDELIPGDLVFKNMPGQGGVNHVGIYIGKDQNGKNLYVHCEGGSGVVVNSYKGFKYPRRPLIFD
ncbi:NlpC/P60 family protein [Paenibacillus sp. FSL W8-0919]|uniref:C40 family peptidase n=1 Tax=Paenibacillus sp. FSL W8-0919 TaxID=2954707 RepID=UPI0030F55349